MPRFLPIGKEAKGAAGFLLAALPALGALLTALAISGDLIGRMARNHPLASFGAFGSAALAVFLGAVAAYGLQEGSREERGVLSLGIVVLGAALVFGVYAGVATWGDRTQPSITVTPKSGSLVAVFVHQPFTPLARHPTASGIKRVCLVKTMIRSFEITKRRRGPATDHPEVGLGGALV